MGASYGKAVGSDASGGRKAIVTILKRYQVIGNFSYIVIVQIEIHLFRIVVRVAQESDQAFPGYTFAIGDVAERGHSGIGRDHIGFDTVTIRAGGLHK